jgi:ABC-2 type transport system permease protein
VVTTHVPDAALNGSAIRPPAPRTPPPAWPGSGLLIQIRLLTGRSLRAWLGDSSAVVLGVMQPVVILFLLTGVFSKVQITTALPPGVKYFDFVLPAILVDNAVQTSLQSGVGLVDDLKNGIVARLRSLPIQPASLLVARSLTNLIRSALQVGIILVLAIVVMGHHPHSGLTEMTVSVALTLLMGWSLGWIYLAAAAWYRRAEPIQNLAIILIFPLMFASSAYVPISDLPSWLGAVAHVNPLTYAINATRALSLNEAGALHKAIPAALLSAVLAVVGIFLAVLGFRRPL